MGAIILITAVCAPAFLRLRGAPDALVGVPPKALRVDVAVLLGGDPRRRAPVAAELLMGGRVRWILVTGAGDCLTNQRALIDRGVPADAVVLECHARNTDENARLSVPLLHARGVRTAVLVTARYHTRRALLSFRHYAPDITFHPLEEGSAPEAGPHTFRALWNTAGELEKTIWYATMYRLNIRPGL
jgi:uncharacterized SAM-binding protein YcdF (DUF218 family)